MTKRLFYIVMAWAATAACGDPVVSRDAERRPNFVIIFTDDQGFGDLSCFGGNHVSTPRIAQMAAEGARLTSFYVAAPVCTPSRAGLITGCYPKRIGMATGSNFGVLLAGDKKGLNPDEVTIAEVLKSVGYKTGMFGKWHLGDQPKFMPTRRGFDEFFGIPYSHDIHPRHPRQNHYKFPPLPLVDGEKVIDEKDIWPVLSGDAKTPHDRFFYHGGNTLRAVRSGDWKLHWNKRKPTQLYNLETDIAEKKNLLKSEPEVVERLVGYLKAFEKEIAANSRPAAFVENPVPLSK